MKTQIATTKEQSDRLLKCGLDSNCSDLSLSGRNCRQLIPTPYEAMLAQWIGDSALKGIDRKAKDFQLAPAWSLSALLSLLPQQIKAPHADTPCDFLLHHHPGFWLAMYHDGKKQGDAEDYMWQCVSEQRAEDPIEACVKMIEWLTSNGRKLNEV